MRGTCTECWGSKGGRLFTVKKRGPESGPFDPVGWQWGSWGCSFTMIVTVGASLLTLSQWT